MSLIFGIWIGYAIVALPTAVFCLGALLVPAGSNISLGKLGSVALGLFLLSLLPGMVFWVLIGLWIVWVLTVRKFIESKLVQWKLE